jgi:hypothetical protein
MSTARLEKDAVLLTHQPGMDLSALACGAATELDNLARGKQTDLEMVKQLVEALPSCLTDEIDAAALRLHLDPTSVVVMKRAIDQSMSLPAGTDTMEGLEQVATKIWQDLQSVSRSPEAYKQGRQAEIQELRDFCLALSRSVATHRRLVSDWKPRNPYRR